MKLYSDLADWWPLFSSPDDYAEEATFFHEVITKAHTGHPHTLVEFGSGGGNNASYLKAWYDLTLVDLSPEMLAVSRALNPECEHLQGDMRSARLGRAFDVVFIHDAIDYITTLADLRRVFETAFVHCAPGGVALLVPDYVRETFTPHTQHGGHDGTDRALRYLEWQFDPDPSDTTYTTHYALLLHEKDASVRIEHDQHECGLFARADWLHLLGEAGFQADSLIDPYERTLFVAKKPS